MRPKPEYLFHNDCQNFIVKPTSSLCPLSLVYETRPSRSKAILPSKLPHVSHVFIFLDRRRSIFTLRRGTVHIFAISIELTSWLRTSSLTRKWQSQGKACEAQTKREHFEEVHI